MYIILHFPPNNFKIVYTQFTFPPSEKKLIEKIYFTEAEIEKPVFIE